MSKKQRGNRPTPVKQAIVPPANPAIVQQMGQQWGNTTYGPNAPILPYPGLQSPYGPRQFAYPIATNLNLVVRDNLTPFEVLRQFADLYDVIRLCLQNWFDCAANLELDFVPVDGLLGPNETADKYQSDISRYKEFFESPDKQHTLHEWLNALLEDLGVIDAVAIYPRKTYSGDLYALDLIDGSCYNDEVEILTKSGWKLFQDVNIETDLFATRNPDTKAFEWQKATYFHEADWDSERDGDLYHFTSRSLDLPVTPNHRMVINSLPVKLGGSRNTHTQAPGECIVTAKELADGYTPLYTSIPATSNWQGEEVKEVRIPATTPRSSELVFSGDDFAAFMGMWIAEGCAPNGDQVYVSQKPYSKGYEAYQALLGRVFGFNPCHTGSNFVIGHKALHDYLKQFGHAHEKFIPDVILNMSSRQLAIFWHYYVLGDGHIDKGGRESIRTVSRELVDDLQEVLQKMGFSGSIISHHPKYDTTMKDGRVIRKENKRVAYDLRKRTTRYQSFNVKRMPYKGKIYCVSVPNEVIYVRRNGKPSWCGNTIKPLLDDRGRAPQPPYYAYEQILYGAPAELFTTDDLIYLQEHYRTKSAFGFSRVENIIMRVNQALRKQNLDMSLFTDGNIPAGFISPASDVGWSPEQLITYQTMLDNLLSGNDALRSRMKTLPPGSIFTASNPTAVDMDLDLFTLKIAHASFGVMPSQSGFTDDVNRATAESQDDITYQRTLKPIAKRLAKLFTFILKKYFNEQRFKAIWKGYEEKDDFNAQVTNHVSLVAAGIERADSAATALKLGDQGPEVPRFIMTKTGPFVVDDLANSQVRNAQVQALTAPPAPSPTQTAQGDEEEPGQDEEDEDQGEEQPENATKAPPPQKSAGKDTAPVQKNKAAPLPPTAKDKAVAKTVKRAAGDEDDEEVVHTSAMVAFLLDARSAEALAVPGGEPVNELHLSLAVGDLGAWQANMTQLHTVLMGIAATAQPVAGSVSGIGRFTPSDSSDGLAPVYASVNIKGLQAFRENLVDRMERVECMVFDDFAYTPHITLAYIDEDAPMPIKNVPDVPLVFESIWLVAGDERTEYPFNNGITQRARADLGKWRSFAVSRMQSGKALRAFKSDAIPPALQGGVEQALSACSSPDDVRAVFSRALEGETRFFA